MKKVLVLFLISFSLFTLTACGYRPTSAYVKDVIKGNVFVKIDINNQDPKNSVIIKDSLNEVVISRFHSKLVDNESLAEAVLLIKLNSLSLDAIQYDNQGYVSLYRATVALDLTYTSNGKSKTLSRSGSYDFAVEDGSLISESKRFDVIKAASSKALEDMISLIAVQSFAKDK